MRYRVPTSRIKRKQDSGLNLIPILDAIFILIFFLLMSAQFVKIFEIGSDVPIVSSSPPPKNKKKPLALSLNITKKGFTLQSGIPSKTIKTIRKTPEGQYDLSALHDFLVGIKKKYVNENSIVLEPLVDISYEEIINIMDSIRDLKESDETLYKKDKTNGDVPVKELFNKIIFGNIMS